MSDPYRSAELHQVVNGRVRIVERARGGGETTSNIQSLRSLLLDSDSGATQESRALLEAAFAQTTLTIDHSGLSKVVKLDKRRSRDDSCGRAATWPVVRQARRSCSGRATGSRYHQP